MNTYLVTGTSTGIGRACAVHLAGLGHHVYAGVRRAEDVDELRVVSPERITPVILDVTNPDHIASVARRLREEVDGLTGLVNNAGIGRGGPLEFLELDEWREQFEVNFIGQVAVTKALLPLIRRSGGRVVFVGSILGKVAMPMLGPYNASKFALEGMAEALRHDLSPWGIRVCIVEPGTIRTPMLEKARETADRLERVLPDEARELYGRHLASVRTRHDRQVHRGAPPERVAKAVAHALTSRRPRLRYRVGRDARLVNLMTRLLADRTRERAIRRFAGL